MCLKRAKGQTRAGRGLCLLLVFLMAVLAPLSVFADPDEDEKWDMWSGEVRHVILLGDWQAKAMWEAVEEEYKEMSNNNVDVGYDHEFVSFDAGENGENGDAISEVTEHIKDYNEGDTDELGVAVIIWLSPDRMDDLDDKYEERTVTVINEQTGEPEIDPETGNEVTTTEKFLVHTSAPHEFSNQLSTGVSQWQQLHAKVYWASLGPDYGYDTEDYRTWDDKDSYGEWVDRWNVAMQGSCAGAKWIDMYEPLCKQNLYWKVDGEETHSPKENGPAINKGVVHRAGYQHDIGKHAYTKESYQTIFHLLLNTVREDAELKEDDALISADLYALSCSLASFVNNVVGVNADKNHEDHIGPDVKTAGNAGAILGYGDKDYDFMDNFITRLSSGSSAIGYKALLPQEGSENEKLFENMLIYARYGRLLADMGFDKYGVKTTYGSSHLFPGGAMLCVFILSSLGDSVVNVSLKLLRYFNPFQLLQKVPGMASQVRGEGQLPNIPVVTSLLDFMKEAYEAFQDLSWTVVIPIFFALLMVSLFANTNVFKNASESELERSRASRIRIFVFRVAFIAAGVPILGGLYTTVLNKMVDATDSSQCASTQIVASTFVNFEEWAKQYRLDPVDGGTFRMDVDDKTGGGEASAVTLANLRKTALAVNKKTGVVSSAVGNTPGGNSLISWNQKVLSTDAVLGHNVNKQCLDLLTAYTNDDYYYPSSWQSETMSVLSAEGGNMETGGTNNYYMGRRKGWGDDPDIEDEDLHPENSVYVLMDATNETKDWNDREMEQNNDIFANTNDMETWKPFNLFANGGQIGNKAGKYVSTMTGAYGPSVRKEGGLSTLSLYNYLSSRFEESGLIVYSNQRSSNMPNKYSHHSVNLIGSGVMGALYYMNTFVVMLVATIVSVVYAMSTLFSVLRKGMAALGSIPGASLGIISSIATMVSTVIVMCLEVVLVTFMYGLVVRLMTVLISGVSNLLVTEEVVPSGTTILGGVFFERWSWLLSSPVYLYGTLLVTSGFLFVISLFLWYYRRGYRRCANWCLSVVWQRILRECGVEYREESLSWISDVAGTVQTVRGYLFGFSVLSPVTDI